MADGAAAKRDDVPDLGPVSAAGVYAISVAAVLVGTGVQNLRAYEKAGLIEPDRTPGGTRLYSQDDISRLKSITDLLDQGLNLAGIAMVLQLQAENRHLRAQPLSPGLQSPSDP